MDCLNCGASPAKLLPARDVPTKDTDAFGPVGRCSKCGVLMWAKKENFGIIIPPEERGDHEAIIGRYAKMMNSKDPNEQRMIGDVLRSFLRDCIGHH